MESVTNGVGFLGDDRVPVTVDWAVSYRNGAPHMHGHILVSREQCELLRGDFNPDHVPLRLATGEDTSIQITQVLRTPSGSCDVMFISASWPLAA